MNKYELVYIVDAHLALDVKNEISKQVLDAVTKAEGKVVNNSVWLEKQRFTFPIKKCQEGTYYLVNVEAYTANAKILIDGTGSRPFNMAMPPYDPSKGNIKLIEAMKQLMQGKAPNASVELGDLEALAGVRKFPVRIKCAALAWNVVAQGLNASQG